MLKSSSPEITANGKRRLSIPQLAPVVSCHEAVDQRLLMGDIEYQAVQHVILPEIGDLEGEVVGCCQRCQRAQRHLIRIPGLLRDDRVREVIRLFHVQGYGDLERIERRLWV